MRKETYKADEGTPDSTNLSLSLFTPSSQKAQAALARVGRSFGFENPSKEKYKEWNIFIQGAMQGQTPYKIIDATNEVADVIVAVRLAWPQLAENSKNYDEDMEELLYNFINSINGYIGSYEPQPNEVVRRPVK